VRFHIRYSEFVNKASGDEMSTISDINPAPVIFRVCIGLLLCSHSLTTQAAQSDSSQLDLFAVRFVHADNSQQSSYHFFNTVVSADSTNLMFGKTSSLPAISEFKKGAFWITSIRWHLITDNNHASLSPQIRLESKVGQLEIRPLQRSVLMTWRTALP
jgi:hypothetical protein